MQIRGWFLSLIIAFIIACVGISTVGADAQAALVFHSGFETGDFGEWTSVTGSPTIDETIKKTGDYAMRCNAEEARVYIETGSLGARKISFYLYITTAPNGDCYIARTMEGASYGVEVKLSSDRYLTLDVAGDDDTGSTQLATGKWYRICVCQDESETNAKIYLDGVEECSADSSISGYNDFVQVGVITYRTADLYFDDIIVDDTDDTTDIGDIRVLRASPTADGFHCDWKNESDVACSTADCFASVDECPAATADYAWFEANGALNQQTWTTTNMTTLEINGMTPNAISSWFYYSTGGGGGVDEYFTYMRDNGTDYSTSVDDPKNGGFWVNRYDAVMPNGGGAWTEARVDAYEIGMATDDANKDMWCYTAYKMIAYTYSAAAADISNTPSGYSFGTVTTSSATNTTADYFTVTNSSGGAVTITIQATDFTGGNGWTLSDTATPGSDTVGINATAGDTDWDIIVKKTSPYNTLVAGLADSANQTWGLMLFTPTSHSDGVLKESTVTLAATLD